MLYEVITRKIDPALAAFTGGEDYALLGAAPAEALKKAKALLPDLVDIGRVTASPGIRLNGAFAETAGFDHFSRS